MRSFVKMHGLGNDFVIFDGRADAFLPDAAFCRAVADRHRGIGCDQIIVLGNPISREADLFMRIVNADGTTVKACGNGTRCVAALLFKENGKSEGVIETEAGLLKVWRAEGGLYAVDFGPPRLGWKDIPLAEAHDTLKIPLKVGDLKDPCCVNMGNPHAVFFVRDVEHVQLEKWGPQLETHPLFPDRCNIEAAQILAPDRIRMRVWERGTGITQACGTGAAATHVAAVRRGLTERRATIVLDGGELVLEWRETDGHVILAGGAAFVFRGVWGGEA
jgi:diaminopimelate epimerase